MRQVMTDSMAKAAPPGGVPCTPGSRMLFDDDGNMVLLDPHAGTYGGGFGDYFGFRDLLTEWRGTATSPAWRSSARHRREPWRGPSARAAHQGAGRTSVSSPASTTISPATSVAT